MDFFEHQDNARQHTWKLIGYFSIAVIIIVLAVNAAAWATWVLFVQYSELPSPGWQELLSRWWQSKYFLLAAGGTLFLILIGSLIQWMNLSKGGPAVAKMVGARSVSEFKYDEKVTQFTNVVEEMSIASGTPVPQLFVMDRETGINAFVAGYQLEDTVMVVTRGLLDTLDREQIQAVTGHEFSHILNGDMRLNMRLMSLLAGILMIGQFGKFLLAMGTRPRHSYRRTNKQSSTIPLIVFGLIIWLIGGIGVYFGRLIKAAVSRQREFLADASSVQFTRNPNALAGALNQIKKHQENSLLSNRHAEDMSHLCFGASLNFSSWLGNLSTHPPLDERIKRVSPNFLVIEKRQSQHKEVFEPTPATTQAFAGGAALSGTAATGALLSSQTIIGTVGRTQNSHLDLAHQLYRQIPEKLRTVLHQSAGAKAFCIAIIVKELSSDELRALAFSKIGAEHKAVKDLLPWVQTMPAKLRLPCIDLCLPTLKQMLHADQVALIKQIESLAKLDNNINMTEWLVISLLRHHLLPVKANRKNSSIKSMSKINREIQTLLSALVYSQPDFRLATENYKKVMSSFNLKDQWLLSKNAVDYASISLALWKLRDLNFLLRKPLLQACADIVMSDGKVSSEEYEFLRIVSDSLGCPIPPFIESMH